MWLLWDHTRSVWCELGCFCMRPHRRPPSDRFVGGSKFTFWMQNKTDSPGSGDSETKLWLKPSLLKRKGQTVEEKCGCGPGEAEEGWDMWKESFLSAMQESVCAVSSLNKLSGRERRASHPHRLPFLFSGWGKQDVFHPVRLRDQSKRLLHWNWPQFAPLRVSHLSNICSPKLFFTSPPPPLAEQHASDFPSCVARCLIHLTHSGPLLHNLWPLHGYYHLNSTLFITIYRTV